MYGISNSKQSIILFITILRENYANFGVSDVHDLPATAVSMLHMSCSREYCRQVVQRALRKLRKAGIQNGLVDSIS